MMRVLKIIMLLCWVFILIKMGDFFIRVLKMGSCLSEKRQQSGASALLESLNMERVRTILAHPYPYPHEHSRHAVIAVVVGCFFFISSDNMHTLIHKLDTSVKWWSMYACLLSFFFFFSSPFFGKTIKPSYSNFTRWYVSCVAFFMLMIVVNFRLKI